MENINELFGQCKICGSDRCIGKYLLHPKEMCFIPRIKSAEISVNPKRTFRLVISPNNPPFTEFKELHVIAGPDEDLSDENNIIHPDVYVGDLQEKIKKGI